MTTAYTHVLDLAREAEPPADGILSRTIYIYQDDHIKAVVFGFGQGQELSEHTASKPAMLFFVKGEAVVGLGNDVKDAGPGTFVHMPPGLKHSIQGEDTGGHASGSAEVVVKWFSSRKTTSARLTCQMIAYTTKCGR